MAELGARSPLVLAKLGHDMRPVFKDTLRAPLPEPIQKLADELDGYAEWQDVGAAPEPEPAPEQKSEDLWKEAVATDTAFQFDAE